MLVTPLRSCGEDLLGGNKLTSSIPSELGQLSGLTRM